MAWSNSMKSRFVRACTAAGIGEDGRHMILSVLPNAHCPVKGCVTSTATKLNISDFRHAMAAVEQHIEENAETLGFDRVTLPATKTKAMHQDGPFHWRRLANQENVDAARLVCNVANELIAHGRATDQLLPALTRQHSQRTDRLDQLTVAETGKVIEALKGIAKRYNVRIDHILTPGKKKRRRA